MGVKLQSSSGGSVEIAAPVTASNYVLTAPAGNGTVDYLQRAGNVLQVVNATYSTQTSTTSTSYVDTGLSATITPTKATNKILAIVNITGIGVVNASAACNLRLNQNTTPLIDFELEAAYAGSVTSELAVGGSGTTYLDSPNTTSPTMYKAQFKSNTGNTVYVALSSSVCTITLMEIAG